MTRKIALFLSYAFAQYFPTQPVPGWVGSRVTVMPNVHIDDGAVIGACGIVTHDISANAIAVGIPAKVIRYRGDKT